MKHRIIVPVILGGLVLVVALFAGGSLPGLIGGATALDIAGAATRHGEAEPASAGWAYYGGDQGGNRYSALDAITPENVGTLEIAWKYATGDLQRPLDVRRQAAAEGTPILVEDTLVFCTPFNEVIALNPGSGAEIWRYDPKIDLDRRPANQFVCRGVAYWKAPDTHEGACAARIYTATTDSRLIALDARTGAPCASFGDNGAVAVGADIDLVWPGEFQMTSPPVVIGETVVVGSSISDNVRVAAPSGAVRAFDARTGAAKWSFDPAPGLKHGNVWAPISVDEKRGLIFLPTTSASPDFFGGLRKGNDDFTDSVVALRGETGEIAWSFQTVHHDVWDYDLPAQPGLYTVWRDGAAHDVVAQVTKTGLVFVLDRDTGAPFLPIEERPVPQGGVAGETLSPTQPFPAVTPPIVPSRLSPEDAFGLTLLDKKFCEGEIRKMRREGLFTPPSLEGTLIYPFNGGGANWGGAAYDETRNLLIVNMSNAAHRVTLVPASDVNAAMDLHHDAEIAPQTGAPYGVRRDLLLSPLSLPCTPPPWGVIAGVDLDSGEIVWRRRIGTTKDVAGGIALDLGTPNLGGPIATGGGLVFIGAAMDDYLRAFSTETGEEIWKGRLPAGGQATPMTYEWKGRQYVVIYAGGHGRMTTTLGDSIVAFALPHSEGG
ncbi:MAG: pyrroloquinoline quinone-dependent dehydrogenase [Parvularculaceae bacterium]